MPRRKNLRDILNEWREINMEVRRYLDSTGAVYPPVQDDLYLTTKRISDQQQQNLNIRQKVGR